MQLKVLFHGVPVEGTEAQLSAGPAAGQVWVVSAVYLCNTADEMARVTLSHRISGANRPLLQNAEIPPGHTIALGPLVVETGQSIWAAQETANAVQVVAYGFEDEVDGA